MMLRYTNNSCSHKDDAAELEKLLDRFRALIGRQRALGYRDAAARILAAVRVPPPHHEGE
jgi:hypothetical protein